MAEWISVKDRLPGKDTEVLCYHNGGVVVYDYGHLKGEMCFYYYDEDGYPVKITSSPVTHWMPLPEAPKGD